MSFTEKDIEQIKGKGLTVKKVNAQIQLFKIGLPFINLKKAAIVGHGILQLNENEIEESIAYFNTKRDAITMLKFVPASGAATRMFKFLFNFIKEFNADKESINSYINRKKDLELSMFLIGLKNLPFYYKVKQQLYKDFKNFDSFTYSQQALFFIKTMLGKGQTEFWGFS